MKQSLLTQHRKPLKCQYQLLHVQLCCISAQANTWTRTDTVSVFFYANTSWHYLNTCCFHIFSSTVVVCASPLPPPTSTTQIAMLWNTFWLNTWLEMMNGKRCQNCSCSKKMDPETQHPWLAGTLHRSPLEQQHALTMSLSLFTQDMIRHSRSICVQHGRPEQPAVTKC